MITTSQNRVAVNQVRSAVCGQALTAAVVHQRLAAMRPYLTRRTRLPFEQVCTFQQLKRSPVKSRLNQSGGPDAGSSLHPRLWASLVLSKTCRG